MYTDLKGNRILSMYSFRRLSGLTCLESVCILGLGSILNSLQNCTQTVYCTHNIALTERADGKPDIRDEST